MTTVGSESSCAFPKSCKVGRGNSGHGIVRGNSGHFNIATGKKHPFIVASSEL